METKTAGEMMIPLDMYPHIPYWFTIRQAAAEIQHSSLEINGRKSLARAVLVFDEEYKLLGMVRRRDIIKGLNPEKDIEKPSKHSRSYVEIHADPELLEISFNSLVKKLPEMADKPVSDIMTPVNMTLNFGDHIMKIIYEMNEHKASMLPVMKEDVVVGVVRTVEVMNEIAHLLEIE